MQRVTGGEYILKGEYVVFGTVPSYYPGQGGNEDKRRLCPAGTPETPQRYNALDSLLYPNKADFCTTPVPLGGHWHVPARFPAQAGAAQRRDTGDTGRGAAGRCADADFLENAGFTEALYLNRLFKL